MNTEIFFFRCIIINLEKYYTWRKNN